MVVRRVPPPPPIAQNDPVFNRWLHDLTEFITAGGNIDTSVIPGYDDLVATVDAHSTTIANHTAAISSLTTQIGANTSAIAANTAAITTHTLQIADNASNIATNAVNISTLAARSQVYHGTAAPSAGLGVDGDWFSDTSAHHIYVKVGGTWVLIV